MIVILLILLLTTPCLAYFPEAGEYYYDPQEGKECLVTWRSKDGNQILTDCSKEPPLPPPLLPLSCEKQCCKYLLEKER